MTQLMLTEKLKFLLGRVESIVEKRKCWLPAFSPSPMVFLKGLSLSQTSPGFYVSAVQDLKTLWEKEKSLVSSNFSFSHSAFYPFR